VIRQLFISELVRLLLAPKPSVVDDQYYTRTQ